MSIKIITENKKAWFDYEIIEKFEAGLVLKGSEVKSLRNAQCNLGDAYAVLTNGEAFLLNCHISPYPPAAGCNHEPLRTRKLLLHRSEIDKVAGKIKLQGLTLIPTKIYFKEGRAKVELALAKGKQLFDKREDMKKKEAKRSISRALKQRNRE